MRKVAVASAAFENMVVAVVEAMPSISPISRKEDIHAFEGARKLLAVAYASPSLIPDTVVEKAFSNLRNYHLAMGEVNKAVAVEKQYCDHTNGLMLDPAPKINRYRLGERQKIDKPLADSSLGRCLNSASLCWASRASSRHYSHHL